MVVRVTVYRGLAEKVEDPNFLGVRALVSTLDWFHSIKDFLSKSAIPSLPSAVLLVHSRSSPNTSWALVIAR